MSQRARRFTRTAGAVAAGLFLLSLALGPAISVAQPERARPAKEANTADTRDALDKLQEPTLQSVMERLAASGGVAARFSESRALAILDAPIESSGWLYFAPPDWLARHVESPGKSRVIVRDDRVSFRDETGTQTLELAGSEVARAMVGNVMLLMRGDLESLEKKYVVGFRAERDAWTLELEPRGKLLRGIIERLRVDGRGNQLVRMETLETSGDETTTRFSEVRVGVDFSREERERIFSVDEGAAHARETTGREGAR